MVSTKGFRVSAVRVCRKLCDGSLASVNVATKLYSAIARGHPTTVTFPIGGDDGLAAALGPKLKDKIWAYDAAMGVTRGQALVAKANDAMLGISNVESSIAELSPFSMKISFDVPDDPASSLKLRKISHDEATAAVQATTTWIHDFVCKHKLCPFMAGREENKKRPEDRISIRVCSGESPANLVVDCYEAIKDLGETTEDDLATVLLVCPGLDHDVDEFFRVVEHLIYPSFAFGQTANVATAWFHPHYEQRRTHVQPTPAAFDYLDPPYSPQGHIINPEDVLKDLQVLLLPLHEPDLLENKDRLNYLNDLSRRCPHAAINLIRNPHFTDFSQRHNISVGRVCIENILELSESF